MNAEGNLQVHVLRRKRGSACTFGVMELEAHVGTSHMGEFF